MTGGASSVIGPFPGQNRGHANSEQTLILEGDGDNCARFSDSNAWVDVKEFNSRPNETAKLVAERTCWNEILAFNQKNKS